MTDDVVDDPFFYPTLDLTDGFETQSVLCVPIRIESSVCGVLELVNRTGPGGFREKDRRLLEIFADYASISIQNLLDARRAYEVAKRDGLTGLYNERYLHLRLTQELSRICARRRRPLRDLPRPRQPEAVNDHHGHLAGSQVLREVGYLLTPHGDRRARDADALRRRRVRPDPARALARGRRARSPRRIRDGDPQRDVPLPRPYGFNEPALNLHGRDHGVARRFLDPIARDARRLRRAAEERAPARRRRRALSRQVEHGKDRCRRGRASRTGGFPPFPVS